MGVAEPPRGMGGMAPRKVTSQGQIHEETSLLARGARGARPAPEQEFPQSSEWPPRSACQVHVRHCRTEDMSRTAKRACGTTVRRSEYISSGVVAVRERQPTGRSCRVHGPRP